MYVFRLIEYLYFDNKIIFIYKRKIKVIMCLLI